MKKAFKFILGIFSFILFAGSLSLNVSNMDIKESLNIALADGDTTREPPPPPIEPIDYGPEGANCPIGQNGTDCVPGTTGCVPNPCSSC